MVTKAHHKKEVRLDMALSLKERQRIHKAADILNLAPSVFARATVLREADKIVAEAKAARA